MLKKSTTKLAGLFVALCMALTLVPLTAFAEDERAVDNEGNEETETTESTEESGEETTTEATEETTEAATEEATESTTEAAGEDPTEPVAPLAAANGLTRAASVQFNARADKESYKPGDQVEFTIDLWNSGNENAYIAHINEISDEDWLQSIKYSTDGGASWQPWSPRIITLGDLAANARASVLFSGVISANASGEYGFHVVGGAGGVRYDVTVNIYVVVGTDISINMTADNMTPVVGDTITYTITVVNKGPDHALGLEVSSVMSDKLINVEFLSNNSSNSYWYPWDSRVLPMKLLYPGETKQFPQIRGTVAPSASGTISSTAKAKLGNPVETELSNNSATVEMDILSLTRIEVTSPTKTMYTVGDPLDLNGMAVGAVFSDGSTRDVTASATITPANGAALNTAGQQTVEVSYTFGGVTETASFEVTVNAATVPVSSVTLDQRTLTLTEGGLTATLTATVKPDNATNKAVTWSSDNPSVATVLNGVVTPVAEGSATITVTTVDGNKTADCAVTVNPAPPVIIPVNSVTLDQSTLDLTVGDPAKTLTATVKPDNATDKAVTWKSSNPDVATVVDGVVTPVAEGTATITVTTDDGRYTADCDVTVDPAQVIPPPPPPPVKPDPEPEPEPEPDPKPEPTRPAPRPIHYRDDDDGGNGDSAYTEPRLPALTHMLRKGDGYYDTMLGRTVEVRLYGDRPVSGYTSGAEVARVRALFEKWFTNPVRAIHFDQAGKWEQPVKVAAKVDLAGMDTTRLVIYYYDPKLGIYRRLAAPAYWIDANGYLRFVTEYAGEIVIAEGELEKR